MTSKFDRSRLARAPLASCVALGALCSFAAVRASDESPNAAALGRALEAIQTEHIKTDIFTIADDDMGGRNTPSDGQRKAAAYIVSRLEKTGMPPGYKDGYLFPYPLTHLGLIADQCSAVIESGQQKTELRLGEHYFFLPGSFESAQTEGGITYAGSGDRDDFKGLNLKDRWALCTWSETLDENGNGPDASRELQNLAQRAEKESALGLLVMPGANYDPKRLDARMLGTIEYLKSGSVSWPGSQGRRSPRRNRGGGSGIPVVVLSGKGAIALQQAVPDKKLKRGLKLDAKFREVHEFTDADHTTEVEDICAFWKGSDAELSKEVIIISAHYDHVGYLPDGRVNNGADDNGSGSTGLMNLAEALVAYGPLRRSIQLIWVSGEEKGLFGSKAWVENPWLPEGCKPVANINIDMIGRNEPDKLLITPTRAGRYSDQYNGLVKRAEKFGAEEGFPSLGSADLYYERSDQANFHKLGIPVCFLFSDIHEDYHQPTDDPEKIDLDKIRRVTRLVMRILDDLQENKLGV